MALPVCLFSHVCPFFPPPLIFPSVPSYHSVLSVLLISIFISFFFSHFNPFRSFSILPSVFLAISVFIILSHPTSLSAFLFFCLLPLLSLMTRQVVMMTGEGQKLQLTRWGKHAALLYLSCLYLKLLNLSWQWQPLSRFTHFSCVTAADISFSKFLLLPHGHGGGIYFMTPVNSFWLLLMPNKFQRKN